jgi:hypothetical protein
MEEDMAKGKRIRFKNWDCELRFDKYCDNDRTAMELVAWEDDDDKDVFEGEPISTCTVNIPEASLAVDEVIIKDYSENEGMLQTLLDAGVVELAGRSVRSGFVTCPVCILVK